MATRSFKRSNFNSSTPRYSSFLAGNAFYVPPAFESIATATPSGTGTVTFSSIPSGYASLQIRTFAKMDVYNANAAINIRIRFNGDSASTYWSHFVRGDGSSASAGSTSNTFINVYNAIMDTNSDTSSFAASIIDIHDYASTTRNKTVRYVSGNDKNLANTQYRIALGSGLWSSTSAVTSIELINEVGNYGSGTVIALYGIRAA